ncbi:hypothetical protein, partial [uncultured Rikenella sp.]|uniref:hypothetical protein n=1 Tax=uncultured Rikenella sp. TaxID=368003 RepID=UPI002619A421
YVEIQIHAIGIADRRRPAVTVAANVHQIAPTPKIPPVAKARGRPRQSEKATAIHPVESKKP